MADSDFEFDEFFDQMNIDQGNTSNTRDTRNTSNTCTTNNTLHPFSVRLDEEYVEVIKALAWWGRISQREFIESLIDNHLQQLSSETLSKALNKYQDQR